MRQLILIPICFLALGLPVVVLASGAQGGFDAVVSSIESRYHVHAERIPLLGLISFFAARKQTSGVSGIHVAEIENLQGDVDGEELNTLVQQRLGQGWERVIRETSRRGSQTLIFMHPEGKKMGMFVLDLDGQEMNVVQMSVDPSHLSENIGKYEHHRDTEGETGN